MLEFAVFNAGTIALVMAAAGVLAVVLLLGIFLALLEGADRLGKLRAIATKLAEGGRDGAIPEHLGHVGIHSWEARARQYEPHGANGENPTTGRGTG